MPPSRRALNCRNRERRLAASEETIRQEVSRCEFVRRVWPRRSRCAACRPQGGSKVVRPRAAKLCEAVDRRQGSLPDSPGKRAPLAGVSALQGRVADPLP